MAHEYISDKELGSIERISEEISIDVWNGIVSVYENAIANNLLSGSFPEECPDGQGISGCNRNQLENAIKAEIPKLPTPSRSCNTQNLYQEDDAPPDKYAILNLIEFLYKNIKDHHAGIWNIFEALYLHPCGLRPIVPLSTLRPCRYLMDARLGSDGRLTLSGWLFNQLAITSFAWRTNTLVF